MKNNGCITGNINVEGRKSWVGKCRDVRPQELLHSACMTMHVALMCQIKNQGSQECSRQKDHLQTLQNNWTLQQDISTTDFVTVTNTLTLDILSLIWCRNAFCKNCSCAECLYFPWTPQGCELGVTLRKSLLPQLDTSGLLETLLSHLAQASPLITHPTLNLLLYTSIHLKSPWLKGKPALLAVTNTLIYDQQIK